MKDPKKQTPAPTDTVADACALQFQSRRHLSDVLGSYTGTDANGEAPEQDADDL